MPKFIYWSLIFFCAISANALGQSSLKTNDSVTIQAGFITESVVLADDAGEIYLEFIKGDRVAKALDGQVYDGEILPPIQIDAPAKAPRARMRELLSFEVISDNSEEVELIDQFSALHSKERFRQSFKNQAGSRSQGAQVIVLFESDQLVNDPALWHYDPNNSNTPWERLGGIMGETPAGETKVFSAFLFGSGQFTIWDENPQPDFQPSFPNDEIELAEPSPFPSVTEESEEPSMSEEAFTDMMLEDENSLDTSTDEDGVILNDDTNDLLIPALEDQTATSSLVPAVDSNSIITTPPTVQVPPVPSDLQSSAPNASANASRIQSYFLENTLALDTSERDSLGNPTTDIVEAFEARRQLISNDNITNTVRDELIAQAEAQILTAEMAEIVIDSLDNQIALANGLPEAEEQTLWVNIEQPNAYKVLNKIEEIEAWQAEHPAVYSSLDLTNPVKLRMDLMPTLKAHYEAYFNLPTTGNTALQASSFQDFGVEEGDLPEAGGFRFPWFLLILMSIVGFTFYAVRHKPY